MPVVAVIDDEPLVCEMVDLVLHAARWDVQIATTAAGGAALLTSRYFDLALIDVLLQDKSGILLAEIAANQNTPVLLMTGHADTALRLRQFDFPHLMKPFDSRVLSEAAAKAMADRHRNIQRLTDSLARLRANHAGQFRNRKFPAADCNEPRNPGQSGATGNAEGRIIGQRFRLAPAPVLMPLNSAGYPRAGQRAPSRSGPSNRNGAGFP